MNKGVNLGDLSYELVSACLRQLEDNTEGALLSAVALMQAAAMLCPSRRKFLEMASAIYDQLHPEERPN